MENILIINLKRFGDIYSSSHLINSLKRSGRHIEVSLLVYKEFEKAAKNIKGVSQVFTIDRKAILTLRSNKLFSDAFSLNSFKEQLSALESSNFNRVLNYSNDQVSAYITSYLSYGFETRRNVGVHYSLENISKTSSDWDIILNDVIPTYEHTPIHLIDCHHKMMNTEFKEKGEKLKTSDKHDQKAIQTIGKIRKAYPYKNKIVGIQLKTSSQQKDLPLKTLYLLIDKLISSTSYLPILLIAPFKSEREYAKKINKDFNNSLIIAEAELQALHSVLFNIDLLITPDTVTKHIADLTNIPVLELALGGSPFLKQGTYNPQGFILTRGLDSQRPSLKENWDIETADEFNNRMTADDIYKALLYMDNRIDLAQVTLSKGISLYQTEIDSLGLRYKNIAGDQSLYKEVSRFMSRHYLSELFDLNQNKNEKLIDLKEFSTFSSKDLLKWIQLEKVTFTNSLRNLLGTIRSLLKAKNKNNEFPQGFISSLEKLIIGCNSNNLIAIPSIVFRSKIDSLSTHSFESNIIDIEALLYELKSDIQKGVELLQKFELSIIENDKIRRRETFRRNTDARQDA